MVIVFVRDSRCYKPRVLNVLLVQVRDPGDPMSDHEYECVTRRLGHRRVRLHRRSVFAEEASRAWLDGVDAAMIGGSGSYSVHDPRSAPVVNGLRDLVDGCLETQIPGFGICFGHQLVGLHLGGSVVTDMALRESGTVALALTDEGREDPVMSHMGASFHAHTGHSDHVATLPRDVTLLATGDRVSAQAFRVNGTRFYTTQFHPDLIAHEARERYNAFADNLGPEHAARTRRELEAFDPERDHTRELLGRFIDHVFED